MISIVNLDKRICDVKPTATNTQTYREFIRESEETFGLLDTNDELDIMTDLELVDYLGFIDYLWEK